MQSVRVIEAVCLLFNVVTQKIGQVVGQLDHSVAPVSQC